MKKHLEKRYLQLISLKGEPHVIACGFAIGVFIGVTPTIPFHTVLIILLCFLFKKNITAGYLGSWFISNPLTIPVLYVTQYRLGKFMLGASHPRLLVLQYSLVHLIHKGWEAIIPLLIGGFIMAPFFAVPSYFIAYKIIKSIRKNNNDHCAEPS